MAEEPSSAPIEPSEFTINALDFDRKLDLTDFVQQMDVQAKDHSHTSFLNEDPFGPVCREGCAFFLSKRGQFCLVWNTYDPNPAKLQAVLGKCTTPSRIEHYRNPRETSISNAFTTPHKEISIHRSNIYVVRGCQFVTNRCGSCGERAHNFDEEEALGCVPPPYVRKFGSIVIPRAFRKKMLLLNPAYTTEEILGAYENADA